MDPSGEFFCADKTPANRFFGSFRQFNISNKCKKGDPKQQQIKKKNSSNKLLTSTILIYHNSALL